MSKSERIVSATRVISASAARIFELIADPSRQPSWDGNNNLASSAPGQRVHQVGDVFKTTLTNGAVRENHVMEFVECSKIAWCPAEPSKQPPGHLWRWEVSQINPTLTTVTHTYDWTALTDPPASKEPVRQRRTCCANRWTSSPCWRNRRNRSGTRTPDRFARSAFLTAHPLERAQVLHPYARKTFAFQDIADFIVVERVRPDIRQHLPVAGQAPSGRDHDGQPAAGP